MRRWCYKRGLQKKKVLREMKLVTMGRKEKLLSPEKMQAEILKRPRVKRGVVHCVAAITGEGREGEGIGNSTSVEVLKVRVVRGHRAFGQCCVGCHGRDLWI